MIKGGDYCVCEVNVYCLVEVFGSIIDQCVVQGVFFVCEYGGMFDNCLFGGIQVQCMFYVVGQMGQQFLLGVYLVFFCQIGLGCVKMYNCYEMMDLVIVDGKVCGIIVCNLVIGELERYFVYVVIIVSGGYGNVYFFFINVMGSNVSVVWKVYKKGVYFVNFCYVQIYLICILVYGENQLKLIFMLELLCNFGCIWVLKKKEDVEVICEGWLKLIQIVEEDCDYYFERCYFVFGNFVLCDVVLCVVKE